MNTEDLAIYDAPVEFVEGLGFVQHVAKDGTIVVDENGVPLLEPRLINVKELIECGTFEEVNELLGSYFI